MKVLWPHNFDPAKKNKGNFMYPIIPYMEEVGIEVELLYLGNLGGPKGVMKAYRSLKAKASAYDVVHAQYGSMCALISAFACGKTPLVLSLRGSDWNRYSEKINKPFFHSRLAHLFSRISLRKASAILPVSNRMIATLPYKYRGIATRFPSAINLEHWPVKEPGELSGTKILFVAQKTNSPNKQKALVEQVLDGVKQHIPEITLHVAQSIPFEEMPQFVRRHDVLLCLSINEGWPNSVKEALACNIPFVATDVSDLQDIAEVEDSCMVCERDVSQIVQAVVTVLNKDLSSLNLRRHVEEMDVRASANKLKEVYTRILSR